MADVIRELSNSLDLVDIISDLNNSVHTVFERRLLALTPPDILYLYTANNWVLQI